MSTTNDNLVVRNPSRHAVHFSSTTCEWATPLHVFERYDAVYRFNLDPCSTHENAKCKLHFTQADDGLAQSWADKRVWMNPPYGNPQTACKSGCKKQTCARRGHHVRDYVPGIIDWMRKALDESLRGALIVCLVPARTDTHWWHLYATKGEIEFLRGRLKFGGAKNSAPFPSAVVVFKPSNPLAEELATRGVEHGTHLR
jgi:site-specific DNA-methyltransferase (adenine-specific)